MSSGGLEGEKILYSTGALWNCCCRGPIAIESLPDNLDSATLCKLRSTVVARARLSVQEATAVFARGRSNLQDNL